MDCRIGHWMDPGWGSGMGLQRRRRRQSCGNMAVLNCFNLSRFKQIRESLHKQMNCLEAGTYDQEHKTWRQAYIKIILPGDGPYSPGTGIHAAKGIHQNNTAETQQACIAGCPARRAAGRWSICNTCIVHAAVHVHVCIRICIQAGRQGRK